MAPLGIAAASAAFDFDVDVCLARIAELIARARRRGARLLVLPEGALGGYMGHEAWPGVPDALVEMAGDMVVCVGYTEIDGEDRYAAAACVSGDGVLGHHRKVHLPPSERFALTPGHGFAAFDTPVGRLGMLICYDKLFPESARALALDGAEIICALSAWPLDHGGGDRQRRHFDLCDELRAIENRVVWVSSNQIGPWADRQFVGSAKVVDPDGTVLASTGMKAGLAFARVDVAAEIESRRTEMDHLGDRRPAAYLPAAGAMGALNG